MGTTDETNYRPPFAVGQDRSIDHQTVSFYCTSCPFKAVDDVNRPSAANGSTNNVEFNQSNTQQGGFVQKINYKCESPNFNYKQTLIQETSTVGFGWCPFLPQKLATKLGGDDHED